VAELLDADRSSSVKSSENKADDRTAAGNTFMTTSPSTHNAAPLFTKQPV